MPRKAMETLTESMFYVLMAFQDGPRCGVDVAELVERVAPQYLTHELAGSGRKAKLAAVKRQITTLQKGGLCREKEVLRRG